MVVAPPGLYGSSIYVADITGDGVTAASASTSTCGAASTRRWGRRRRAAARAPRLLPRRDGLVLDTAEQIWRIEGGAPLQPLPVRVRDIGEALEGRLVTFRGVVSGWQGTASTSWTRRPAGRAGAPPCAARSRKRPYVHEGDRFTVTGVVSQFAREDPWNGGYRVLVRWRGIWWRSEGDKMRG